jgi:8-oxo-dGTP pyrophosphatase MutT (NUDIX family)
MMGFVIKHFGSSIFQTMSLFGMRLVNARMIVMTRDEKILLVRSNFHDDYILPGGAVNEYGEHPISAALRECSEEVSLKLVESGDSIVLQEKDTSCVGCYLLDLVRLQHRHIFFTILDYTSDEVIPEVDEDIEIRSAGWHDREEIEGLVTPDLWYILNYELPEHRKTGRQFVRRLLDIPPGPASHNS